MASKKTPDPGVEKVEEELIAKRELFCRYYAQNSQYFGNGTHSYAAAYGYELESLSKEAVYEMVTDEDGVQTQGDLIEDSEYDKACHVCATEAGRMLRKPEIQERITTLRNEWMTDAAVDGELASVIQQNGKLEPKVAAIKEFNKVRGRIIDKTQQVGRLPFGEIDLSAVIETLSKERQDYYYEIIATLTREAELSRSTRQVESSSTGNG